MVKDGVLDSVIEGKTGVFFYEQTSDSLKEAILKFEEMKFNKAVIREHSLQFDEKVFQEKIKNFVLEKVNIERNKNENSN